jgi:hypothetical protein
VSGRAVLLPTRRTMRPAKSAESEGMKALVTINNLTNPLRRRKVEASRRIPARVVPWVQVAPVADADAVAAGECLHETGACAADVVATAIADRLLPTIGRLQAIAPHPAEARVRTTTAKRAATRISRRKTAPSFSRPRPK